MTFVLIVWNEKDERLKGENLTLTARARTQAESIEALSASYAAQDVYKRQVLIFRLGVDRHLTHSHLFSARFSLAHHLKG